MDVFFKSDNIVLIINDNLKLHNALHICVCTCVHIQSLFSLSPF